MNMLSPFDLERRDVQHKGVQRAGVEQVGVDRPAGAAVEPMPFAWLPLAGGFLRRRLALILAGALGMAALGFLFVSQQAATFTAGTTLLVDQRRSGAFQAGQTALDTQGINAQIESQVEVLRSYGLAQKVVERLNLADTRTDIAPGSWLIAHRPSPIKAMLGLAGPGPRLDDATRRTLAATTLSSMIAVRRVGLTFVIEASVVAESPEAAARLANALVEAYIADQLDAKSQATQEASAWLGRRIAEISGQAKAADQAVQDYKRDHNIVATDEGLISEQQLTALTARLAGLRAATIAARAELDRARLMLVHGDDAGSVIGDGLQSTVIDNLRQKLVDKQRQYTDWRARFGPRHEVVLRLAAEIAELQAGIKGERKRIVSTATNSLEIATANQTAVQAQVDAIVQQSGRVNSDRVQLRALQSKADTYRALDASFLQRYSQAAQNQSFPVSDVEVISAASPPLLRSGPKRGLIVGGAGVLGLGLGLMAGLVAEMASHRPRPRRPARAARGLECIGTLPLLRPSLAGRDRVVAWLRWLMLGGANPAALTLPRGAAASLLRLGVERPTEPFGIAIAALRRELLRRVGGSHEGRVIACLTLASGEGTSTVAANLAHALAIGGHRTVLLDMADGQSSLSRLMGSAAGEAHSAADGFGGRMEQDRITGLLFRSAAAPPGGLLGATPVMPPQTMSALVRSLQRRHDFVIIDLPAVERRMPTHDILMQADDLLMVGRWTEQDEARMSDVPDMALASAVRCLGIVLTMVPPALCDVV